MFDFLGNFVGEIAALCSALIWAIATVAFTDLGKRLPPLQLNFLKGIVGIALLCLTLLVRRLFSPSFFPNAEPWQVGALALSGVVGISIGDTALFASLNTLGTRRTLLLQLLAPPLAALLGVALLKETLGWQAGLGVVLVICGIALEIVERAPENKAIAHLQVGIAYSAIAAFAQASGALLSRGALADSQIDPFWATLIRLGAGTLALLPLSVRRSARSQKIRLSRRLVAIVVVVAFFGTYLGIILQQTALKFAKVGIAQTLNSTSPLFVLPLVALRGERVSLRAVAGVVIALLGIGLLFLDR